MSPPVFLHGALATHRRGQILRESLGATPAAELPSQPAAVVMFADGFQAAEPAEQSRLVNWTREPGRLLLLVPPFAAGACAVPVPWRVERLEQPPRGGDGLAGVLAPQVGHRLEGRLQAPPIPGAAWADLSLCLGTCRLHPAAGVFAVTTLPLWSLLVLDAQAAARDWMAQLADLAGEGSAPSAPAGPTLRPDHFGMLVFLLGGDFADEESALSALGSSTVFRFAPATARELLQDLRGMDLVVGERPTATAEELVLQSPYAPFVHALREESRQ